MVYDQLLRNAYAQVAHASDLFSLDPSVEHTYFAGEFEADDIAGYTEIVSAELSHARLAALIETPDEFLERRNRFLDHLLARFGEGLGEFAMLLSDLEGQAKARADLVRNKIAFLLAVPGLGHDRGKAFDRTLDPCDPDNGSGLKERVHLLLGLPDWKFVHRVSSGCPPGLYYTLVLEDLGRPVMTFDPLPALDAAAASGGEAERGRALAKARRSIVAALVFRERYAAVSVAGRWRVEVHDEDGNVIGTSSGDIPT